VTTPISSQNAVAQAERRALCDLLLEVGPGAPTLSGDWTARDLAAHLYIRENRPDAAAGIIASPLAAWTAKVQGDVATRDYATVVADVRGGPPRWSFQALPPVDAETNTVEYFVHHEDVRRAREGWSPRTLDAATTAALWQRLAKTGRFFVRRCPVGVGAVPSDGPAAGTELRLRSGDRSVILDGPVGEIVLAVYGRPTRGLDVRGDDTDVEAFRTFRR
jgi:uncharacterized protein (TIGR03085 family)